MAVSKLIARCKSSSGASPLRLIKCRSPKPPSFLISEMKFYLDTGSYTKSTKYTRCLLCHGQGMLVEPSTSFCTPRPSLATSSVDLRRNICCQGLTKPAEHDSFRVIEDMQYSHCTCHCNGLRALLHQASVNGHRWKSTINFLWDRRNVPNGPA